MTFHEWIEQHARGDLDAQMTEAMNEVDGTVTLELKVDDVHRLAFEELVMAVGGELHLPVVAGSPAPPVSAF